VSMRSSDVWLGLPYDIFNFSMVAKLIQLELRRRGHADYPLGVLTIFAGSSHLYKKDIEKALLLIQNGYDIKTNGRNLDMSTLSLNTPADLIQWLRNNRNNPSYAKT
jgi:thymidylate synthase